MKNPKFNEYMKPALIKLNKSVKMSRKELYNALSKEFMLDAEVMEERYATGEPYYEARISWALTFLKKAGLIEQPERSVFKITNRGTEVLLENPIDITQKYLMKFDSFKQFNSSKSSKTTQKEEIKENEDLTPLDSIDFSYKQYKKSVTYELLNKIHENSPEFFERLVLDLLWRMGYGEAKDDLHHTGKTNDKGIDGIVYEDKLGLSKIYIQAKRYELSSSIDRATIQQFVGAIPNGFSKGVFVTTAKFSKNAEEYALSGQGGKSIVLIDGNKLAELMYDFKLGLQTTSVLNINQIDLDYFDK